MDTETDGSNDGPKMSVNSRLLRWLFRMPIGLYRLGCGRLLGSHLARITHIGRSTGVAHHAVVEVMARDLERDEYIVMVAFGPRSDWYQNICKQTNAGLVVGTRRMTTSFRELEFADALKVFESYEARRRWMGRALPWLLSKMVGWTYDGSPSARHRLVLQCPVLAFRPVRGSAQSYHYKPINR